MASSRAPGGECPRSIFDDGTLPMLGTFVTVLHRALPAVIPVDIAFAGAALWILRKRRMRRKMQDV